MQPNPGYKTGNQFVSYQQVILVILHIQALWFTCSQRLLNYLAYQSLWMYLIILVTQCTIVLIRKNIDIFHIRTIVHWVTNLSWFCNQTSYLMFSILGQWIYHEIMKYGICHGFVSIFHLWLHFFFISSQRCKGDNSNWLNKILHWNLLGQYQPIILRDLT